MAMFGKSEWEDAPQGDQESEWWEGVPQPQRLAPWELTMSSPAAEFLVTELSADWAMRVGNFFTGSNKVFVGFVGFCG